MIKRVEPCVEGASACIQSTAETKMFQTVFLLCFQFQLAPLHEGVAALHLLLGGGGGAASGVGLALPEGRAIATPIEWPVVMRSLAARGAAFPAFADLGAAHAGAVPPGGGGGGGGGGGAAVKPAAGGGSAVPAKYAGMSGAAAVAAVTARLVTLVMESTGGADVDVEAPLMESGLDSVAGVELQQRAEQVRHPGVGRTSSQPPIDVMT
jgi:hypothetical protein